MGLGADHVIRGGDAAAGPIGQAGVVDHGAGQWGGPQIQEPVGAGAGGLGGPAQGTAQARQQRRRRSRALRHRRRLAEAVPGGQVLLGLPHQLDHPLVALLRCGAEGEEAVLEQHHALELHAAGGGPLGGGLVEIGAGLGQGEAGHHVGHQHHPLAKHLATDLGGIGLVGQGQQRRGMGVIHEGVGQEGMQQGLHRGVGGGRIDQVVALGRHHRLIAEGFQSPQGAQGLQPHRRVAGRFDRGKVPAGTLHAENGNGFSQQAGHGGLHRGVAAAMQHQIRVGAEQAGRVGAQGQRFGHAPGAVVGHGRRGLGIGPAVEDGHGTTEGNAAEATGAGGRLRKQGRRGAGTRRDRIR